MNRKILIVTGDGGESYETLYAVHRFQEEGDTAVIAAPSKRRLNLVMHDFEPGWDTYIERPGYCLASDLAIEDVIVDDYDAILLLGGRAPEYLRNHAVLLEVVREFDRQGKWVFAICHGIQILVTAGLASNRNLTAYEHVRTEIEMGGGTYSTQQAIRDRNIVTGQTWQSHPEFYREVFACLKHAELVAE
ncbi:DJ-1/PfpI family protein [Spirosoma sp. KCTC 42546]|uniref:DJ-1/PfpI family protein n=1 Tax=Spirosoma sp. KCTC 42546 TaxID=2520506 RepID=UPI001159A782|nr:DJ-1/PfpI family protein [Spirosoma sp. KCTC 42546]QDK79773.1 DJ-1/PfpI family protein [Spirosoma sp. KCTC 42546]